VEKRSFATDTYACRRSLTMYNYRLRIDKRQGVLLHLRQAPPRQRNNIYILLVMSSSAEVVSRRGVRHHRLRRPCHVARQRVGLQRAYRPFGTQVEG
jgi:hypothetical protein